MVAKLIEYAYSKGYGLTFGEAWRPPEMQILYVTKGLSRTVHSKHTQRLAVDFNLFKNGKYIRDPWQYLELGKFWESLGGRWGGRFGVRKEEYDKKIGFDANHFEYGD